jgi:hypothetical protein
MRVTAAQRQLHRAEQWVVEVAGTITAESVDDQTTGVADVVGSVGFSGCAGGNEAGPCAFYIGSAHIETVEKLDLDLDCDGQPVTYTLDGIEIDLVQPAMGIDFADNAWKAFPPGALVSSVLATTGQLAFGFERPNQQPVYLEALDGWFKVQGTGGFVVEFDVLCGLKIKPIKAWLGFQSNAAPHGPPNVSIDMPSSVTCSTVVSLDAVTSDPEGDHNPTRWEVDGVLLESSVTCIKVNEAHTIRAIVEDVRGATKTDTHVITCT